MPKAHRGLTAILIATGTALTACAGNQSYQPYQSTYTPPPGDCVQIGDHFECGRKQSVQVATTAPVNLNYGSMRSQPPPLRSVAIEYSEGQPVVRISLPGVASFRCVLDTGSSDLAIPFWLFKELYDHHRLGDKDVLIGPDSQAILANGSVASTTQVMFYQVDIGPWHLTNVPAVINISLSGDCLLGMSVLKVFGHPLIDFATGRLILEN